MTQCVFYAQNHAHKLYKTIALLNQVRAGRAPGFLKIDPVQIVSMRVCVCVCVSAPKAINN